MITFLIGLVGQGLFFVRTLVQWLLSEHYKKVLSPSLFWIFSLVGACVFFLYGWLRNDFSIILGQSITYFIYIWNLKIKNAWNKIPLLIRVVLYLLPVVLLGYFIHDINHFDLAFFGRKDIPLNLIVFGSLGQIIFTLRFVYQWYYSYHKHYSILPAEFWYISLLGSFMIIAYAIKRHDLVLMLGQSVGLVAYIRNVMIGWKEFKKVQS